MWQAAEAVLHTSAIGIIEKQITEWNNKLHSLIQCDQWTISHSCIMHVMHHMHNFRNYNYFIENMKPGVSEKEVLLLSHCYS